MSKKELVVAKNLPNAKDMTVLELGPYIGKKTRVLSKYYKSVLALEGRQENLDRCPYLDNVIYSKFNVENLTVNSFGRFDLVFHSGVFYHLPKPREHLHNVCKIADIIILDTHYSISQKGDEKHFEPQEGRYKTGLSIYSYWITKGSILNIFKEERFETEVFFNQLKHKSGSIKPRIKVLAKKCTC